MEINPRIGAISYYSQSSHPIIVFWHTHNKNAYNSSSISYVHPIESLGSIPILGIPTCQRCMPIRYFRTLLTNERGCNMHQWPHPLYYRHVTEESTRSHRITSSMRFVECHIMLCHEPTQKRMPTRWWSCDDNRCNRGGCGMVRWVWNTTRKRVLNSDLVRHEYYTVELSLLAKITHTNKWFRMLWAVVQCAHSRGMRRSYTRVFARRANRAHNSNVIWRYVWGQYVFCWFPLGIAWPEHSTMHCIFGI